MDDYPKILVALTTSNKLYARFLRYLMGSRFHHSLLFVYFKEFGGWMAIDVDKAGPHMISTRVAFEDITDFECCYCKFNLFDGVATCRDYMGTGYDTKGVLSGIVLLLLKRFFKMRIRRTDPDPVKMYCLEYVASVLKFSNVPTFKDLNVSELSTRDFHELIEQDSTLVRFNISKSELLNAS